MLFAKSKLETPPSVHLMGCCGAGMTALAEVLSDRGWKLSGCDADPDPTIAARLQSRQIDVRAGHAPAHLDSQTDALIFSPAIPDSHPERQAAAARGIPQFSYVDVLAQLMDDRHGTAIAGTHGKSTTTAMLGTILHTAGRDPTVLCGATLSARNRNGWSGSGADVIVEACEYRGHFHALRPQLISILGIEPDHFDCYPTLADSIASYGQFVEQLPETGRLVVRSDCDATRQAVRPSRASVTTFSLTDAAADWRASDWRWFSNRCEFRMNSPLGDARRVRLRLPGRHNVLNALAAAACAAELGITLDQIIAGLEAFTGLKRRFDVIGEFAGRTFVDDYAHHPTEIRETLRTARDVYPRRWLTCVFQPHQISRTMALGDEFVKALGLADQVFVLPVFLARESANPEQERLARELAANVGSQATFIPSLDRLWNTIQTDADRNAVILTLGAGNLTRVYHELTRKTERSGSPE